MTQSIARRETFLPFSPPSITEAEIEAVADALRSGWLSTGPRTRQFEADFAAYMGVESALALNSCTAGLHLALKTLGIGPGDEVIVPSLTFCSSVNVIEHVGATPVLVDVEPVHLTIDPPAIEAAITPQTKAVIVVHYAGHPAAMREIMGTALRGELAVIEDAAHAFPALYEGQRVGTIGDFAAFSFYATKNMTTGEGGMLLGHPDRLADARVLSLHGMSRDAWKRYENTGSWYYEVHQPGFKYNMTDIQAALGSVQLSRLESMQARRRAIVAQYNAAFGQMPQFEIPAEDPLCESAWHLYVLRLHLDRLSIDRARFIDELKLRNIGTSVHFIPVHIQPYYRDKYDLEPDDVPVTYREYQRLVSLPLHPGLTDADVQSVIDAITDIVERC